MPDEQSEQDADSVAERVSQDLARTLDEAARGLIERSEEGVEHTLELIVRGAIATVPHVEQAGVSLVERGGTVESHAPSSEVVRDLDRLQSELQEGPCLDSIWHEQRILVQDMASAGERWPRWAPAAAARGVESLISFQLFANKAAPAR